MQRTKQRQTAKRTATRQVNASSTSNSRAFSSSSLSRLSTRAPQPSTGPSVVARGAGTFNRKMATSRPSTKTHAATASRNVFTQSVRHASDKVFASPIDAVKASGLKDGDTLLAGGFGLSGIPMSTIRAIHEHGAKDLVVVSNNCGTDSYGLGILLNDKRIKRMVASYVGENAEFERQYLEGELELVLTPQGTLAEKLRAGGAGIPAFYTPTAAGTLIQEGGFPVKYKGKTKEVEIVSEPKEVRVYNGKPHVLEDSIRGEVAIIKGWKADRFGNTVFRGTARNFNQDVGMAGKFTIVEVEEIVDTGSLDPAQIHLSGGYIQAVVKTDAEKRIERRTVITQEQYDALHASTDSSSTSENGKKPLSTDVRERIARRAALELADGMNVNLGIGMPTLIPKLLPKGMNIMFQSENGLLGMGGYPVDGEEDPDFINAGKETITLERGASLFSSSESFAMIRGGHIDLTILGAMEVAENGDLANWIIPGKLVKGMGGAMDLVACGSRVVVTMEHNNKKGAHKILTQCALPLTGKGVVDTVITDLAVFQVDRIHKRLLLTEKVDDITVDELRARTGAPFEVSDKLTTYQQI